MVLFQVFGELLECLPLIQIQFSNHRLQVIPVLFGKAVGLRTVRIERIARVQGYGNPHGSNGSIVTSPMEKSAD
jgi:hypothetical protein